MLISRALATLLFNYTAFPRAAKREPIKVNYKLCYNAIRTFHIKDDYRFKIESERPTLGRPLSDLPVHLAALTGQRGEKLLAASTERRCKTTKYFGSLQMFFSVNSQNVDRQRKRGTKIFSCLLLHVTDVTLSTNYVRMKLG